MQKKRGKRPAPSDSSTSATVVEDPPSKKPRSDKPMSASSFGFMSYRISSLINASAEYEKEVKNYAGRSLKDDGIGVRPLVK